MENEVEESDEGRGPKGGCPLPRKTTGYILTLSTGYHSVTALFSAKVHKLTLTPGLSSDETIVCLLFLSLISLPKILKNIIFKAKVGSSRRGKKEKKGNLKITLFLPQVPRKGNSFDRNNYKAFGNKVNHCGKKPEVDKWRDGNVSTTSAICFLCCSFFILYCFLSKAVFSSVISLFPLRSSSLILLLSFYLRVFPPFSSAQLSQGISICEVSEVRGKAG